MMAGAQRLARPVQEREPGAPAPRQGRLARLRPAPRRQRPGYPREVPEQDRGAGLGRRGGGAPAGRGRRPRRPRRPSRSGGRRCRTGTSGRRRRGTRPTATATSSSTGSTPGAGPGWTPCPRRRSPGGLRLTTAPTSADRRAGAYRPRTAPRTPKLNGEPRKGRAGQPAPERPVKAVSVATAARAYAALRRLVEIAVEEGVVTTNPAAAARLPRRPEPMPRAYA